MKVKEVSVTYARTWQTAPYESLKEEVTLVTELEEGDSPSGVTTELLAKAQQHVQRHAGPILQACGRIQAERTQKVAGLEIKE